MRHINTALYQKAFLSSHVSFLCTNAGNFLQIQFAIVFLLSWWFWPHSFKLCCIRVLALSHGCEVWATGLWARSYLCSAYRVKGSLWLWRGNWLFGSIDLCVRCYQVDCTVSAKQQQPPWCVAIFSLSVIILSGFKRLKLSATAWWPDYGREKGTKGLQLKMRLKNWPDLGNKSQGLVRS